MTLDLSSALSVRDATTAASAAIARWLPIPCSAEAPQDGGPGTVPLPGPGSRAVSTTVSGAATGTLVIVLSAEAADALEQGPLGAADLTSALGSALTEAAGALEQLCDAPVRLDAPHEVAADIALSTPGPHQLLAAAPLTGPHGHVATVALLLGAPQPAAPAIPAPRAHGQATPHTFPDLQQRGAAGGALGRGLDLLRDVEMGVTVELGRTRMPVRDLLALTPGAVVELDRAAGSPVDVLVNGTLIGRGEVVVIDEEFGVRITEIVGTRSDDAA